MTRTAFIVCYAANVLLALASPAVLPERVAIHFGPGGLPDGWAPIWTNTLIYLGLDTFLFILFYFAPRLTAALPAKWSNLPHKEFWLAPENRPLFLEKYAALMEHFGTALFLFLFAVGLLAVQANRADPVRLHEPSFFVCLALFLAYTLAWVIVFFRSFRLPAPRKR